MKRLVELLKKDLPHGQSWLVMLCGWQIYPDLFSQPTYFSQKAHRGAAYPSIWRCLFCLGA